MLTPRIRAQLVAFVVLASVGIVYAAITYADLARFFTKTTYTAHLDLTDSGGIFTNAEVTYRGVTVGRVGGLRATPSGARVDLVIRESAPQIPLRGLRAEVKNLSAIGELYVDLVPQQTEGPHLRDGSVIPAAQATVPVAPATFLTHVNRLLTSVPEESTAVVLDELSVAFADGGEDLGRVIDSTGTLLAAEQSVLEETRRLISDGATVLRTQNDKADSIVAFSRNLRLFAAQLKKSDPDLRRLIANEPRLTTQLSALLRESGPGVSHLIADGLTLSRLAEPRYAAIRQVLITYPAVIRGAFSAVPGDGRAHFGLVVGADHPPPCTKGYESTKRRPGSATTDAPVNAAATCAEPHDSPINPRGSRNAPHAGIPDAVPYPDGHGGRPQDRSGSEPGAATFVAGPHDILREVSR